MKRYWMEIYI